MLFIIELYFLRIHLLSAPDTEIQNNLLHINLTNSENKVRINGNYLP